MLSLTQRTIADSLPEALCMDILDLERDYTWRELFHDDIVRASLRVNNVTGTFDLTVITNNERACSTHKDIGYSNVVDLLPQFGRFDLGLEFGFWCTKKDPKKDTKPMAGFSAKVVYARECTPDGKPSSPLSRDERS